MRYLFFVLILFSIGCSKENDPEPVKYNPVYSKVEGAWYKNHSTGYELKYTFSRPEDSLHTQSLYPIGDTSKQPTNYRYYIDKSNNLYVRESNSAAWVNYKEVKFVNDTLYINNSKFHK